VAGVRAVPAKGRALKLPADSLARLEAVAKDLAGEPKAARVGLLRAQIRLLLGTGWTGLAETKAREWVALAPASHESRLALGNVLLRAGKLGEAEKTYRELASGPAGATACRQLGRIAQQQGDTRKAETHYKKAVELDPSLGDAYLQLGLLAEAGKREREAARYYDQAIRNSPRAALAYNQLAWLYGKHPNGKAKALALARKARELDPDDAAIADTLGWVCFLNGRHDEAVKHLGEAGRKLPGSPDVWYHLGKAQAAKGDAAGAARSYERVLFLAPSFEHAKELKAFLNKHRPR
jgi:tetratricopeptide (TPR) repeat protein